MESNIADAKIGWIGTGLMGSRMAKRLLAEGKLHFVHNRTKEKARDLYDNGATWCESPQEVMQKADIVFTMLANPKAVTAVVDGDKGIAKSWGEPKIWVDVSTVDPDFSRGMHKKAKAAGVKMLDAPVAGSTTPAEKGMLTFLVGGDEALTEQVKPLLDLMGKNVWHMGEAGHGTAMKMSVNMMLAVNMAAYTEAVALAEKQGLDKLKVAQRISEMPVAAPFLSLKQEKLENHDYSPEFPLKWMMKDLRLAADSAYEKIPLPVAQATKELYASAFLQNMGEEDFSAIFKVFDQQD